MNFHPNRIGNVFKNFTNKVSKYEHFHKYYPKGVARYENIQIYTQKRVTGYEKQEYVWIPKGWSGEKGL